MFRLEEGSATCRVVDHPSRTGGWPAVRVSSSVAPPSGWWADWESRRGSRPAVERRLNLVERWFRRAHQPLVPAGH